MKFLEENPNVSLVYCYSKIVFDDSNNNDVVYDKNNYRGNFLREFLLDLLYTVIGIGFPSLFSLVFNRIRIARILFGIPDFKNMQG